MDKFWSLSDWINKGSSGTSSTPLGASRLNAMNNGINEADNRIIELDTTKAGKSDVLTCLSNVLYDNNTGVFTFVWKNGNTSIVDLNIEKIPTSFEMSEEGIIKMVVDDGTEYTCDIASLIPSYDFSDTTTIDFTTEKQTDGSIIVKGIIKDGSITDAMLESEYLAKITVQTKNAESYAESAAIKCATAQEAADLAQSWAIGGTTGRKDENTTNAKYYSEQAGKYISLEQEYVQSCQDSATAASSAATAAADNAKEEVLAVVGDINSILATLTLGGADDVSYNSGILEQSY